MTELHRTRSTADNRLPECELMEIENRGCMLWNNGGGEAAPIQGIPHLGLKRFRAAECHGV